jgi:CRP/FNR family transcriptional regulator
MPKKTGINVISLSSIKAACKECSLNELCLPLGLGEEDVGALDKTIKRRRLLKKGELLYRYGDPLRSLYAVKSGAVKTTGLMEDGRAQVTGFYLPGELLGFDAINADEHPCSAEALEATEVCEIPFPDIEVLATQVPGLQHQLFKIMSREIVHDEQHLMMLGRMTAEERLASCLLSFSRRQARLGQSDSQLHLPMSRQDIGDYLGLALETVSRLFSRFQEEGMINVQGRRVELLDIDCLKSLSNGKGNDNSIQA